MLGELPEKVCQCRARGVGGGEHKAGELSSNLIIRERKKPGLLVARYYLAEEVAAPRCTAVAFDIVLKGICSKLFCG